MHWCALLFGTRGLLLHVHTRLGFRVPILNTQARKAKSGRNTGYCVTKRAQHLKGVFARELHCLGEGEMQNGSSSGKCRL